MKEMFNIYEILLYMTQRYDLIMSRWKVLTGPIFVGYPVFVSVSLLVRLLPFSYGWPWSMELPVNEHSFYHMLAKKVAH